MRKLLIPLKLLSERALNKLSIMVLMVNPNPNPKKTTFQNNQSYCFEISIRGVDLNAVLISWFFTEI